jgi:hypothetical protein
VVPAQPTSNPLLASVIPPTQASPSVDQPNSESSDLFEDILNECPNNGMNSSEFKEFMKNLSISSKGLFIIFTVVF